MKPKLYLDIDGVLLANEENLAVDASEFIRYASENFEVYWLTTHCMEGDPAFAVHYVQRTTTEDLTPYLKKFKPTRWDTAKTEAIDFSKPFLWFDDDCYEDERLALTQRGALNSWIEIDLSKYPDQLTHEIKLLKSL